MHVHFDIQVIKTEVHYWKVENPQHYSAENFPVFYHAIYAAPEDYDLAIYGTSAYEYPDLLKASSFKHNKFATSLL